ncbi:MAG: DUF86 domain-containing protein [Candidatus Lokiarchaeota archaeon]|nr:DUF86 domain-containing protein [Candidatus Lokiarchaeota archaeon]
MSSINLLSKAPQNELEKRGIFYSLQTAIESTVDLVAMAMKDLGSPVKDDESNIQEIVKRLEVDISFGDDLKKANGMSNILVHRYNTVEEEWYLNQ